jgi:hypothetical protein
MINLKNKKIILLIVFLIIILIIFIFVILSSYFSNNNKVSILEKYENELSIEGQRINYCSKDSDCNALCVNSCPGEFIVYNRNKDTNHFVNLYLKFKSESEKLNEYGCFFDFCSRFENLNITCNSNNKCECNDFSNGKIN